MDLTIDEAEQDAMKSSAKKKQKRKRKAESKPTGGANRGAKKSSVGVKATTAVMLGALGATVGYGINFMMRSQQ